MEEICNRCVHKAICEIGAAPRDVSVITGCYNFRAERTETNADRIRAMTDEELAEWITELTDCTVYPHTRKDAPCVSIGQTCAASWLDWLKQEVYTDG